MLLLTLLIHPLNLNADDEKSIPKIYTKDELVQKVYQYAKNNSSAQKIIETINCEDTEWNPTLQSGLRYKKNNRWGFPEGKQEESYGLAQIHLPDHPDVSYKQAIDPIFSIQYMAEHLGKDVTWSCYKTK